MVKILQTAQINFGILGSEEKCCGETARRIGNEYLAGILIQGNIEVLKNYGVRRILTTCPHGYNTFKNEYPQFGGEFEVIHHTDFVLDLLKNGKPLEGNRTAGLGFLDMAKKADEPIEWNFHPIDQTTSFFSLRIALFIE